MQPFIIDSCSFLHAFHLEIGTSPLSELLQDHFNVLVHSEVDAEVPNALRQAYKAWKTSGLIDEDFSLIRKRHAEWTSTKLRHNDVGDTVAKMSQDLLALDDGERACIAFARHTADSEMTYPLFLTDDNKAAQIATAVFNKYQCGFVLRTADLIAFFGLRYNLSKVEIHQSFRNLLAFYNSTYQNLLAAVSGEDVGSSAVSEWVWRGDFHKASQALAQLSISSDRRRRLDVLISNAEELAGADSVIGYTLGKLRLLAETAT